MTRRRVIPNRARRAKELKKLKCELPHSNNVTVVTSLTLPPPSAPLGMTALFLVRSPIPSTNQLAHECLLFLQLGDRSISFCPAKFIQRHILHDFPFPAVSADWE